MGTPNAAGNIREIAYLSVGDVVQIDPAVRTFGGTLAFVVSVRDWGIVASVAIPDTGGPYEAPIRLEHEQYKRIGRGVWIPGAG